MLDLFERGFLATLGMLSLSRERVQELVDQMVERGELKREDSKQMVDKLVKRGQEEQNAVQKLVRQEVHKAMQDMDLVTRQDVLDLNARLDLLLKKLEQPGSSDE